MKGGMEWKDGRPQSKGPLMKSLVIVIIIMKAFVYVLKDRTQAHTRICEQENPNDERKSNWLITLLISFLLRIRWIEGPMRCEPLWITFRSIDTYESLSLSYTLI